MRTRYGLLVALLGLLVVLSGMNISAIKLHAARRPGSLLPTIQSQMFQYLQNLEREFSIDHTVHWRHGEVTTSMSVAPTNFDGCNVTWSQTQEATRPGQLFYIESHRFEVPLGAMDPKQITVTPVAAGPGVRTGIEPGDYYTVQMQSAGGKKIINMVDNSSVFDPKNGPISSVEQLMVSSAWVRVRQEEKGELLAKQFQQAIAACTAAGQ